MSVTTLIAVLFLAGCGAEPDGASKKSTAPSASTLAAEARANSEKPDDADDPLASIPSVLSSLATPEAGTRATELLEKRGARRQAEQLRIERELMTLLGALATSCDDGGTRVAYEALAAAEGSSLESERALVRELLTAAGAEGRTRVWQVADPGTLLVKARTTQLSSGGATLPAWSALELEEDEELRVRRLLLGLQFAVEALSLDVETELASFAAEIDELDPAAEDAPDKVVAAIAKVDAALLAAQRARLERLPAACEGLGGEAWVSMLERGVVKRYLSTIGGTFESTEPKSTATTGKGSPTASAGGKGTNSTSGMGGPPTTGAGAGATGAGGMTGGQQSGMTGGTSSGGGQGGMTGGQQGGMTGGMTGGGQQGGMSSGGQQGGMSSGGAQQGGMSSGGQQGGMTGGQQGGMSSGGAQQGGMTGGQQGGMTGGQQGGQQR